MSASRERALAAFLSVVGLGVSLYLSAVHLSQGQIPLACTTGGLVDCQRVTTGPASTIGLVPVAAVGVVWFLVALLLNVGILRLTASRAAQVNVVWSAGGVAGVFYLVYVELFVVNALCLWCTVVHVAIIGIFLLAVRGIEVGSTTSGQSPWP